MQTVRLLQKSDFVGANYLLELVTRLNGKVMISSDVREADVSGIDIESLIARIMEKYGSAKGAVLNKQMLEQLASDAGTKKEPVQVEVIKATGFKAEAKETSAIFSVREAEHEHTSSSVSDFTAHFQDRFRKLKGIIKSYGNGMGGTLNSIDSVKQYTAGRELGIVGIVYDKTTTSKGNLMATLEDETGTVKVLFTHQENARMGGYTFDSANKIARDDVIAVRGKVWNNMIIANRFQWPDIPVHQPKRSSDDIAIAFLSDIHVGHKLFLEKQFTKFLEWLNGHIDSRKELAGKIKYLVLCGDLVEGIGVYPEQQKELAIEDADKQYDVLFDFLESVPDYIEVFALPGNHDSTQRAEPQPRLNNGLADRMKNVHLVSNPSYLTLHGLKVLAYHGASLDSIIRNVPGCKYSNPEVPMKEILKRRHLSPVYGGNVFVPGATDPLVIDEVPDILHMGHVHKNAYDNYHGTIIINSGTWQDRTGFQIKQGHMPSPALLPVYETASMRTSMIDFNSIGE